MVLMPSMNFIHTCWKPLAEKVSQAPGPARMDGDLAHGAGLGRTASGRRSAMNQSRGEEVSVRFFARWTKTEESKSSRIPVWSDWSDESDWSDNVPGCYSSSGAGRRTAVFRGQ